MIYCLTFNKNGKSLHSPIFKKKFNRKIVQFPITIPNIFADIFKNGFLSVIFAISLSF